MNPGAVDHLAQRVVAVLVIGFGVAQVLLSIGDWHLRDMGAYWDAGERLRSGEALYPRLDDPEASTTYRYAPWFAWLWIPVTALPREAVGVLWSGVLLAASAIALAPAVKRRAWIVVALFAPMLIGISAIGNAHPLLIAGLVHGVDRRSGPLWIALAASLKLVPIVFVLTYIGRGQWPRAAVAIGATVVLVVPASLYDLSRYPTSSGQAAALIAVPGLYVAAVAAAAVITVRLARSRTAWLASAATVTLAVPRLFVYDVTYVLVGLTGTGTAAASDEGHGRRLRTGP